MCLLSFPQSCSEMVLVTLKVRCPHQLDPLLISGHGIYCSSLLHSVKKQKRFRLPANTKCLRALLAKPKFLLRAGPSFVPNPLKSCTRFALNNAHFTFRSFWTLQKYILYVFCLIFRALMERFVLKTLAYSQFSLCNKC